MRVKSVRDTATFSVASATDPSDDRSQKEWGKDKGKKKKLPVSHRPRKIEKKFAVPEAETKPEAETDTPQEYARQIVDSQKLLSMLQHKSESKPPVRKAFHDGQRHDVEKTHDLVTTQGFFNRKL